MTLESFIQNLPRCLALLGLMCISGLISGSETALFSLTRPQLARFRRSSKRIDRLIIQLCDNPRSLLSTVLLANIAVNILLYSMLAVTVSRLAGDSAGWTAALGISGFLIVLIGAEIVPKLVAFSMDDRLAPLVAPPLYVLELITLPVRWVFEILLVEPLTRILTGGAPETPNMLPEELQKFVAVGRAEGVIDVRENIILHGLMDLADLRVGDLMVHRLDMVAYDLADGRDKLVELFRTSRLLRIPVYEGRIDAIKGVVSAKDCLAYPDRPLARMIRPVRFVPEQARVESLLRHFRTTASKLAVVVDEYGGLAGVIALEDVVEAIVGQLHGHSDVVSAPSVQRINQTTYLVDAALEAEDFCDAFNLPSEISRFHTVAGLLSAELDRIPEVGDQIALGGSRLEVVRMIGRRVRQVRLILDVPVADSEELDHLMKMVLPESRREASLRKGEPA